MKKAALIIAIILTAAGAAIFTGALAASNFDFSALVRGKGNVMEEHTYNITESFRNIKVDVQVTDVTLKHSEDGSTKVAVLESEKIRHNVEVENDALKITSVTEQRKWFDLSWLSVKTPSVVIYLPEKAYEELRISSATGDIRIPDGFFFSKADVEASTGDVELSGAIKTTLRVKTSTGDIGIRDFYGWNMDLETATGKITLDSGSSGYYSYASVPSAVQYGKVSVRMKTGALVMKDFTCGTLETKGSTGSIRMTNVVTRNAMSLERSTGSIHLESCDAENEMITIETSTGSVRGSLKTGKIFAAKSSTGSVNVPASAEGIPCRITTSTGSIDITIE